ncbi:MAG TPA: DUF2231 domain-containing protein [Acidobacteriaceae bacterium]|nr:DUF2231 domain-containing protein [Acidobacteriaceae bacterium]
MENQDAGAKDEKAADNGDVSKPAPPPPIDERVQKILDKALYAGGRPEAQKLRNFLNGTWLGEPLHVALTDVPIGAWTAAIIFDLLGLILDRKELASAADVSIGIGLAGAAGAAITGATDWSDVDPPARRLGLVHGLLNLSGTAIFATSLILRRKRCRKSGWIVSALGYGVMSYAAHLGGKMVYEHRVGVDRTDGQVFPDNFVGVLPEAQLPDDKPTRAMAQGVPILLVRRAGRLFALADTCSHFGGPLSEGKLLDNCIECPWHASRFDLEDGHVVNGPAVHPQPCLEVRTRDGQIEVRKAIPQR